jgi:hypothetical protein
MSTEIVEPGPVRFRVGAALGRSFKVLFRNIVPFGLLAILFNLPMQFISQLFIVEGQDITEINWLMVPVFIVGNVLLGFLLSATLVYGTVLDLRGGRAGVFECISRGLGLLLPVVGVGLLVGLVIGLAALLLLIPGIIAMVMLWVAVPVAVVERPGIMASLSRSMALTKGYRWHLLGLILILVILSSVIGAIIGGVIGFGAYFLADGSISDTVSLIINVVVQAFSGALIAVASAVAYHDLRIAKEGASVEQIAAVFD